MKRIIFTILWNVKHNLVSFRYFRSKLNILLVLVKKTRTLSILHNVYLKNKNEIQNFEKVDFSFCIFLHFSFFNTYKNIKNKSSTASSLKLFSVFQESSIFSWITLLNKKIIINNQDFWCEILHYILFHKGKCIILILSDLLIKIIMSILGVPIWGRTA